LEGIGVNGARTGLGNGAVVGLDCGLALLCFNDGVMLAGLVGFAFGGLVRDGIAEDTTAVIFETGHMKAGPVPFNHETYTHITLLTT
jgi:uncharacterized membrane protein YeiH